jgi:asparagine synthase (glutamine-hydrolysing)
MAASLRRFSGASSRHASIAGGAVAVCSEVESVYSDGTSLCAWAGDLRFSDRTLESYSRCHGVARTLIDHYPRYGAGILSSCVGTFAIALFNRDEALLAIDRMGIQPLVFIRAADALIFSSSIDTIIEHPLANTTINPQAIYNYAYFHMVPGPDTIYAGQQRLLPGQYVHVKGGKCEVRHYWQVQFSESQSRSFGDHKAQFVRTLEASVREAAKSDSVGAFLSGGTDSSTLAGMLTKVTGAPARTYSIGFAESGYDEMHYARIAAKHFGTRHNEYYVTPDDIVNVIPRIAQAHDQPFGNSSAVPTYYCARMAKEDGIDRLLGGDGGDELFGGNERYAKQTIFARYEKLPRAVRKFALEPAIFASHRVSALTRKAQSYIEQASVPMPARLETYNLLERFGATRVFEQDFLREVDTSNPLSLLEATYHGSSARSLINRMLALDFKFTLADNDLPKVIRSCELAGVDVRFPLLSDEVVALSAGLPPTYKLRGTKLRWFFKQALSDFLPREILTKTKHGFGLPFGPWLRRHEALQELVHDNLQDLKSRRIVRSQFIDELLQKHLSEHASYYGTMIWVLIMLEQWFKKSKQSQLAREESFVSGAA